MIRIKFWLRILLLLLASSSVFSCKQKTEKIPEGFELASSWADMATYITRNTPANSPTFASRCFGYIGLTMYESVVNGFTDYKSIASQLNGLGPLPLPEK